MFKWDIHPRKLISTSDIRWMQYIKVDNYFLMHSLFILRTLDEILALKSMYSCFKLATSIYKRHQMDAYTIM